MDIFQDYANYMNEMKPLIHQMQSTNSPILVSLQDVIVVTDYIYELKENQEKIDDEMTEIFDVGFGYLTNTLEDLKVYYEEYFKKNILELNHFAPLILYHIYLDDFKWHLANVDELTEERRNVIDKIDEQIDLMLTNKKSFNDELIRSFEEQVVDITPVNDSFRAVYTVFSMIAEELNIF